MKGSGKGILLSQFVKLFGRHGVHISSREHLTGKFNPHLGLCSFLFADEAYYPGDKQVEGTLKQIITEERIMVEAKGRDPVTSKNCLHVAMATNNDWSIPASADERRFFINAIDNRYAKGQIGDDIRDKYFSSLAQEMNSGGREAMLRDLLSMNLDGWLPYYDVPITDELKKQVALSRNRLDAAVFSFLDSGVFPGINDPALGFISRSAEIYKHLGDIDPEINKISDVRKSRMIKSIGVDRKRDSKGIYWVFPTLEACRYNWELIHGHEEWDKDIRQWLIIKNEF
jgi:hypothetical protein